MAFSNVSRYLLTDVIRVRHPATGKILKEPFVDIRQRIMETSPDDRSFIQDGVNHWGGLGLKYLNDARAWWIIADLSGVIDPFEELVDGKQLRAPSTHRYQLDILPSDKGFA